jgi:hypothetical protein
VCELLKRAHRGEAKEESLRESKKGETGRNKKERE